MKSKYKFNLMGRNFDDNEDYLLIYPCDYTKYSPKKQDDEYFSNIREKWFPVNPSSNNFQDNLTYRRKKQL